MKLSKAVITAAGPNQNRLPLQRFVDLDGIEKTALQIIIEEVIAAGIQEIAVVLQPGDHDAYADAAGDYAQMLTFVEQPDPADMAKRCTARRSLCGTNRSCIW